MRKSARGLLAVESAQVRSASSTNVSNFSSARWSVSACRKSPALTATSADLAAATSYAAVSSRGATAITVSFVEAMMPASE